MPNVLTTDNRLTKPNHPGTNGQVERMNRTIKKATVKRFHYDSHHQLRVHLADFIAAYNFARRLKTLSGLTPYEYIAKISTSDPEVHRQSDPPDAGTKQLEAVSLLPARSGDRMFVIPENPGLPLL